MREWEVDKRRFGRCLPGVSHWAGGKGLLSLWQEPRACLIRHATKEGRMSNGIAKIIVFDQVGEHSSGLVANGMHCSAISYR